MKIRVEGEDKTKGLAFVIHGLGASKDQPQIRAIAESFWRSGYTVVSFDTTNGINMSEGDFRNATITQHYNDTRSVIEWAKSQPWYKEPFILSGSSLGGFSAVYYAINNPNEVKAIAPISPFISGQLSYDLGGEKVKRWQESGWYTEESSSNHGFIRRLPWSHMEDRLKYDLRDGAPSIKVPALLVTGSLDTGSTSPESLKLLYDALECPKEMHIIENAPHTIKDSGHLAELQELIGNWLNNLS